MSLYQAPPVASGTTPSSEQATLHSTNPVHLCPTLPVPPTVTLACVWTGYGKGTWKRMGTRKTHAYKLFTWPASPIYEGMHVRLFAVTQPAFAGRQLKKTCRWSTYDPHVQGSIANISRTEDGIATVVVVNECSCNTVDLVEVSVPVHSRVLAIGQAGDSADALVDLNLHDPHVVSNAEWPGECLGMDCGRESRVADARIGNVESRSDAASASPDGPPGEQGTSQGPDKSKRQPHTSAVGGQTKKPRKVRPVVRTYASYSWYQEHAVINRRP